MRITVNLRPLLIALLFASFLSAFGRASPSRAQDASSSELTIEQKTPIQANGKWTLLKPNEEETKGSGASTTVSNLAPGRYTLFIASPDGTSTVVELFRGTTTLQKIESPQITFDIAEPGQFRIAVAYTLAAFGKVGVSSRPPGIAFELLGPNDAVYSGVTPQTFENVPVGMYTAKYHPSGCIQPPPKSNHLDKDKNLYLTIDLRCDALDTVQEEEDEMKERFVSVDVNGKTVIFRDVPQGDWYAPFVAKITKLGIMSGYKDESGEPTGEFGPSNHVTLGELAKLSHEVAGIDEKSVYWTVRNPTAVGTWFETYAGSAEQRDWQVFTQSGVDLTRAATRGEMIATMLQALDVPVHWPKGKMFRDVTRRTEHAGAIETASALGIVTGETDEGGNLTGLFHPTTPINRAEMSKLLSLFMDKFRGDGSSSSVMRFR